MLTISSASFITVFGIGAVVVVAIIAYLVRKLLSYEHRITEIETKIGDWSQYFKIVENKVASQIASPNKNRKVRREQRR